MPGETMTDDPVILKFPAPKQSPADLGGDQADLQLILAAWNEATDRLQRTHETLRAEVHRLSDELEAKNRELARKNRLADLGQMAAHVAHEVRNSLVPMKLYLSLLRRRIDGDSGSLDVLGKITAGLTALEATVNNLLHFSTQKDACLTPVNLKRLLEDVLQSLAPQLAAQSIRVEIDCSDDCLAIVDGDMLRRAVLNLVLNALDAQPHGGQVVLIACRTAAGLEIEVADGGPGVPEGQLERLFEPFFTTKSGGTGLGLAIVERIATAHGGRVKAANCPEGGVAFTLIIPQSTLALEKAA